MYIVYTKDSIVPLLLQLDRWYVTQLGVLLLVISIVLSDMTSTRLKSPAAVMLDPMNNMYVGDLPDNRILFFHNQLITVKPVVKLNCSNYSFYSTSVIDNAR